MKKQTMCVHTPYPRADAYGSLSMPVYHTAAYEFESAQQMADAFCGRSDAPSYSRVTNPTVSYFENKVKALTGAADVTAFNSGMAAISNVLMALACTGKNIVTSRHLFGNTYSLIAATLSRFGVKPKFCDTTDLQAVRRAVDDDTCCVFVEIITNPQLEVADLSALSAAAHAHGACLVADTTAIPFTCFGAAALGVDIEVVSSTKYISGGATSLGGLLIDYGTVAGLRGRVRAEMLYNLGAYMTPHAAYMQTLGLETLHARYQVQAANAAELARRLCALDGVRKVNYPGLPGNRYHDLAARQFGNTAGAMLTLELASVEACFCFIDSLKVVRRATNLFDNKSLAIHPASTIFGNFPPRRRAMMDVGENVVRLSCGLEDADDLFDDIAQAVRAAQDC